MAAPNESLVGSVFERNPLGGKKISPPTRTLSSSGFPVAKHRSQSAFSRGRKNDELKTSLPSRPTVPPLIQSASNTAAHKEDGKDHNTLDWQTDQENQRRIESMTEEEREEAKREILAKFGPNIGDVLRRAREARERKQAKGAIKQNDESGIKEEVNVQEGQVPTDETTSDNPQDKPPDRSAADSPEEIPLVPRPPTVSERFNGQRDGILAGRSITRPSSRADRRLRFATLGPDDVHVYESAPPSPRKKVLALPPPPAEGSDPSIVNLGQFKASLNLGLTPSSHEEATLSPAERDSAQSGENNGTVDEDDAMGIVASSDWEEAVEEGTPEDIRRRFFPNAPADDPSLQWLKSPIAVSNDASLRFDLTGNIIPASLSSTLPTHLGLHHHAEGSKAGYTLDDIFLLSRSTVPAQRIAMFTVMEHIARKFSKGRSEVDPDLGGREQETTLRKRMVAAGMEAMREPSGLGARAIGLIWLCLVEWKDEPTSTIVLVNTPDFPLADFLLNAIAIFEQNSLPALSLTQLLAVINFMAEHGGRDLCTSVTNNTQLIRHIVQTFLLTPVPVTADSMPPLPEALELLISLTRSSRANADKLISGPVDALLRFITVDVVNHPDTGRTISLPPSSSNSLSVSLCTLTLRLYRALACYGLYSQIATTASQYLILIPLTSNLSPVHARRLHLAWIELVEAWMVCAIDPHRTTPDHDILWSQVVAWDWTSEVFGLCGGLSTEKSDWDLWAAAWNAEAAWLEGSRVNRPKSGKSERANALSVLAPAFESGRERQILEDAIREAKSILAEAGSKESLACIQVLTAAIRLWLACVPSVDTPPPSPPFSLPFADISELSALLVKSRQPLSLRSPHSRYATTFLSSYLRLSRCLPAISTDLWIAQAFSVLLQLVPGDESLGVDIIDHICNTLTPLLLRSRGFIPASVDEEFGMDIIKPFLVHAIRPHGSHHVTPLHPTPESIQTGSTQNASSLPSSSTGFPLRRDWTLSALDNLLRSGSSAVFKALPSSWDASETDVVRMSFVFTKIAKEVLDRYSLSEFTLNRDDTVFACMKVFMLEHQQQQHDSTEEVFRDAMVSQLMSEFLAGYVYNPARVRAVPESTNLEDVSQAFLGKATPFYQFYQDFVGLYDSISFSHQLFATLLLPPTSYRYSIDYRKHLWHDYAHVLPTIRTSAEQVVASDIKEYLYPVEDNPEMLSAYLGALLTGRLQGFVRLIATHHIACNMWPDLRRDGELNEEKSERMLRALLTSSDDEVISDVMRYSQSGGERIVLPPECFVEAHVERLTLVKKVAGESMVVRLGGLFSA